MSSHSPVVIIGPEDDVHVAITAERVRAHGVPVLVVRPDAFPSQLRITLGEELDDVAIDGAPVRPACVYARDLCAGLDTTARRLEGTEGADYWRAVAATGERTEMLMALVHRWDELGVPVYNGTVRRSRIVKPYQLALLRRAGLPVPDTCWTNDPAEVRRFAVGRRIAYKPVMGGAATQELLPTDLTDERLDALGAAPVTFQALLPGDDIRVYVLDGEIVAAMRIVTAALDFRGHEERIERISLPEVVAEQCRRAAQVLGLRFTGIDLKGDDEGTLRFLEANPSPMFVGFDELAGTEIGARLAARLAAWGALPERVFVRLRATSPSGDR